MVKLINEKIEMECELFEADLYDFDTLEHLEIPVIFALDRCEKLFEFSTLNEKDSKNIRAYRRRYLNNIRYAVLDVGDAAFAEYIDSTMTELGAKQIMKIEKSFDETQVDEFIESFTNKI